MLAITCLILFFGLSVVTSQEPCNLFCGGAPSGSAGQTNPIRGQPGPPGKQGPQGLPGATIQCDCSTSNGELCQRIRRLEENIAELEDHIRANAAESCKQIKQNFPDSDTGLYTIHDLNGNDYKVYCDMNSDGGGWTLVASIHENNPGESGKCTAGDRWSSEQGNSELRPSGDGNWQNRNIFGDVTAATSDDYKNPAYFEVTARDIMIWQVPNDTPLRNFNTSSYLRYRTTNGFLTQYGGNLFHLYSEHYPITSNVYTFPTDSGPSIPVVFDEGDAVTLLQHLPTNSRPHVEAGYIQFRAISYHRDAFALCPGIRNKPSFYYPSQSCLGSAGWVRTATSTPNAYCGDFSGFVHPGNAPGIGWSADETLLSTSFMIFYR